MPLFGKNFRHRKMLGVVAGSLAAPPGRCPGRYVVRDHRPRAVKASPAWLTNDWCTANCDTPNGCSSKASDLCGCGPCTSHAYFPKHKVVICTVAKASSSTWRKLARRIHAIDEGKPSENDVWCGTTRDDFRGCLLDQTWAPAGVSSFEQLEQLVHEQHYTPAVFLRDPIERVLSMYTGTRHAQGVDYTNTSLAQFVGELEWGKYNSNEHMATQMGACNFGRPMNASGIPWKFGASTPRDHLDPSETAGRAQRFVAALFGEEMLTRVNRNWTQCNETSDEFFSFDSQAKSEASLAAGDLVPRIRALYKDDVEAYEDAELQYEPAGTDLSALVPVFVQTVPGR